jgi:MalT-like TPR region
LAFCFILNVSVCPITLMTGDMVAAQRHIQLLIDSATRQGFTQYVNTGRCFEATLQIERNEFAAASVQLHAALEVCDQGGWSIGYTESMGALARSLAALGRFKEALATVDRALARAEQSRELWYVPELKHSGWGVVEREARRVPLGCQLL